LAQGCGEKIVKLMPMLKQDLGKKRWNRPLDFGAAAIATSTN
jgi:hypothetical protein